MSGGSQTPLGTPWTLAAPPKTLLPTGQRAWTLASVVLAGAIADALTISYPLIPAGPAGPRSPLSPLSPFGSVELTA